MRKLFNIVFFFLSAVSLSQELPPDPNKVEPPPGHKDPDPVIKPLNKTKGASTTTPLLNGYQTIYNKHHQKSKEGVFSKTTDFVKVTLIYMTTRENLNA